MKDYSISCGLPQDRHYYENGNPEVIIDLREKEDFAISSIP